MLLKSASQDVCVCNDPGNVKFAADSCLPLLFAVLVWSSFGACRIQGTVWRQGLVRLFIGGFSRCLKEKVGVKCKRGFRQLQCHLLHPSLCDQDLSGKFILAPGVRE
jgi:hypothetical protein